MSNAIPPEVQRRFFHFFFSGCERISQDDVIQMLRPSWCKQTGQICLAFKQARRQQWNLSNLCYCLEKVISAKLIINSGQPSLENIHHCFLLLGCLLLNLLSIDFTQRHRQPTLTAQTGPWLVEKKLCAQVFSEISSSQGQLSERIAAFIALQLSSKYALDYYTLLKVYFCTLLYSYNYVRYTAKSHCICKKENKM